MICECYGCEKWTEPSRPDCRPANVWNMHHEIIRHLNLNLHHPPPPPTPHSHPQLWSQFISDGSLWDFVWLANENKKRSRYSINYSVWRDGSIGRASDSKAQRFESRQEHNKNVWVFPSKTCCADSLSVIPNPRVYAHSQEWSRTAR